MTDVSAGSNDQTTGVSALPYRLAVLCYLFDDAGRLLLLHRQKQPNSGMYSPIGGKLELALGESPQACALREIHEEAGLQLEAEDVRLLGLLSETAYEGETHWLIFLFEVTRPINPSEITNMVINEGELKWISPDCVQDLEIPETDRRALWPTVQEHRGGFFMMHIDCTVDPFTWNLQESIAPSAGGGLERRD